jgi:RNA polymerase sigma factor (sigma-70 family)
MNPLRVAPTPCIPIGTPARGSGVSGLNFVDEIAAKNLSTICPARAARGPELPPSQQLCHGDDMEAVALLLTKLRKLLLSRGRTVDDTDDLIQEAFLRLELYCRDHQVQQPEAFLVRTALNLSVDERRSAHARRIVAERVETLALIDPRPTPDEVLATQQRLQRMKRGLQTLSPRVREVFLMNRLEGYSYGQIAERLDISESAVEKHIAKASQFLWEWMNREEGA